MLDTPHADVNKKPWREAPQRGHDLVGVRHSARSDTDISVQEKISLDPKAGTLRQDLSQATRRVQHYMLSSFLCFYPMWMLALLHSSSADFSWCPDLQLYNQMTIKTQDSWLLVLSSSPKDARVHILSSVAGTQLIVCSMTAIHNTCQNWLYFGYQLDMLGIYVSGSPHKRHVK